MVGGTDTARGLVAFVMLLVVQWASAGWFNEHKYIGDIAFKRFVAEKGLTDFMITDLQYARYGRELPNPFKRNWVAYNDHEGLMAIRGEPRPGVVRWFTYGDLTGLAGDHSADFIQLITYFLKPDVTFILGKSYSKYGGLDADIGGVIESHHQGLEKFLNQGDYGSLAYARLAAEDRSHFQRPPLSVLEMLGTIDQALLNTLAEFMALDTSMPGIEQKALMLQHRMDEQLLKLNNTSKYAILHAIALHWTFLAAQDERRWDKPRMVEDLTRAFITNAFADHFLQDAFASGHLPVKRNCNSLDNKGVHDYYCRVGINVVNERGESWRTFGDNFYDDVTYAHAIAACQRSISELWEAFELYRSSPEGTWNDLFDDMRNGTLPETKWPSTIKNSFNALVYAPIPLSADLYRDAIVFKRGSKNGMFYEAGYTHLGGDGYAVQGGLGIGYCIKTPEPHEAFTNSPGSHRIESILWTGIGAEFARHFDQGEYADRFIFSPHLTFKDRLSINGGLGWSEINGTAYFTGNAMAGVEFKYLSCRVAPSIKYFLEYGAHRQPYHGIRLSLRFY